MTGAWRCGMVSRRGIKTGSGVWAARLHPERIAVKRRGAWMSRGGAAFAADTYVPAGRPPRPPACASAGGEMVRGREVLAQRALELGHRGGRRQARSWVRVIARGAGMCKGAPTSARCPDTGGRGRREEASRTPSHENWGDPPAAALFPTE